MSACATLLALLRRLQGRRWVRFGVVGGLATLCYAALGLCFVNGMGLPALAGNALAYVLSFVVSYLGQSRWTFQADGRHRAMLPRFAATQGLGLAANSAVIWLLMAAGLPYAWAMLLAAALVPALVYALCAFWVFRRPDTTQTRQPATGEEA